MRCKLCAGKPFARLMREALLEPLGMSTSTFDQVEVLAHEDRARGHIQGKEVPPLEVPMLVPADFIRPRDMAKFVSFQLAGGVAAGRRLVAADLLRSMERKATTSWPISPTRLCSR